MFDRIKSIFAAKPPREFLHPEFGVLILDSGIWSGEVQQENKSIRFHIGGTDTAPDAGLLHRLRELIGRFPQTQTAALDFLRTLDPSVVSGEFEFYSLNLLWEDRPNLYGLEFTLAGDIDGIWRVEFENDQPTSVGRDD